ncbi:hypothetical protein GJ496_000195 [Pomphorhynchus laevis]|nr:hypothetical protein GJ496_000195 [Pomphorhynchus laevis]
MTWNYTCCYLKAEDPLCYTSSQLYPLSIPKITTLCDGVHRYQRIVRGTLQSSTCAVMTMGIILHILCIWIFIRGSFRKIPSIRFFILLSLWNIVSLSTNHLSYVIKAFRPQLYTYKAFCAMFGILFIYPRQLSSCILALISIEHMFIMKYPFHRLLIDKYRTTVMIIVMLFIALPIPLDIIFYVTAAENTLSYCHINIELKSGHAYQVFRNVFITLTYALIPFIANLLCDFEVLRMIRNKMKKSTQSDTETDFNKRGSSNIFKSSLNQRTRMKLLMSVAFLVLLMPYYSHWFVTLLFDYPKYCKHLNNLYEDVQLCMGSRRPLFVAWERILRDINHSIHFFIYIVTSQAFRHDAKYFYWQCPIGFLRHGCKSGWENKDNVVRPMTLLDDDT